MSKKLEGIWTALWTPTDNRGNLLKDAILSHLHFLEKSKVKGVVVGGSTGEFPYLSKDIRNELLKFIFENKKNLEVIVNISAIHPKDVEEIANFANQFKLEAVMLLPPMFFPFAQSDIAAYFLQMAKIAKHPLVLYNFPECVRNLIELETLDYISEKIPIAGIKQSGSDFEYHIPLIELAKKRNFSVITGYDTRLKEALDLGALASIGGLSNAVPELIVEIYQGHLDGKTEDATKKIAEISPLLHQVAFPLNIAALMEARGLEVGSPKMVMSTSTLRNYQSLKEEFKKLFLKWKF